jgi:hypothetical protein
LEGYRASSIRSGAHRNGWRTAGNGKEAMGARKQQAGGTGLVGRRIGELSLPERLKYANKWVAFRIYTPTTEKAAGEVVAMLDERVKRVEAAGDSVADLFAQLQRKNLDPAEYEFTILKQPY